jgi:hypothetical protein
VQLIRVVAALVVALVLALALGWAALAIWFDGPASRPLAAALDVALLALVVALLVRVRPLRRALAAVVVVWAVVLGWWLAIPPRADRDWRPEVARVTTAEVDGDVVHLHDVRNFDYRSETDFTERWEDRTYDLSQVRGVDLFLSFWGPTLVAHTIMSWEFADGRHLAISIETRKERGEEYSAVRGFFRQYEIYYVVADERDVVRLRTDQRGERVFLYRLRGSPAKARALLASYVAEVDALARRPQWYNALTQNCTTTIRSHVQDVGLHNAFDWRLLVNGRGDEMLYERGDVNTTLPLAVLRARSDVTARARAAGDDPRFSALIREGLPARPAPRS